ncbi:MAG: AI-2E family transporter, partial [Defluviitaleaceae bacterium]|nr:AI-2E family transporter [Defluviitaleaceae bacterium]
ESNMLAIVYEWAPDWLGAWGSGLALSLTELAQSLIGDGVAYTSITLFRSLPSFIMWVLLFAISSFFFVKDRQMIREVVARNSPRELRVWFGKIKQGMLGVLTGYVKAQLFIGSIVGIITVCALALHGYQYALFMGLLIAVLDALPIIGSSLILIPWALISIVQGQMSSGLYFMALWAINFLVRQLLEPKVLSVSIGIHPIMMLISMYTGLRLIGPLGLLVGPMWVMSMRITFSV